MSVSATPGARPFTGALPALAWPRPPWTVWRVLGLVFPALFLTAAGFALSFGAALVPLAAGLLAASMRCLRYALGTRDAAPGPLRPRWLAVFLGARLDRPDRGRVSAEPRVARLLAVTLVLAGMGLIAAAVDAEPDLTVLTAVGTPLVLVALLAAAFDLFAERRSLWPSLVLLARGRRARLVEHIARDVEVRSTSEDTQRVVWRGAERIVKVSSKIFESFTPHRDEPDALTLVQGARALQLAVGADFRWGTTMTLHAVHSEAHALLHQHVPSGATVLYQQRRDSVWLVATATRWPRLVLAARLGALALHTVVPMAAALIALARW